MQETLPSATYRQVVADDQAGLRLDQFLAAAVPGLSRGLARRLIDLGGAHVDGRRMRRCGQEVAAGQRVELYVDGLALDPFQLDDSMVLYRDRYLLALDKPAGVATQPTPARFQGTVYAALQNYLGKVGGQSLGMVQRLDRDTSGVLLFSIHPRAHKGLTAAFAGHRVEKRYLALVAGRVPDGSGEICSQLARRRSTNRMVSVERGGKPAVTRYRLLTAGADLSLVEVEILTGRSHQIRVHFAELGHPLLGDGSYGGPVMVGETRLPRQMLHAGELCLDHPVSGERLVLKSPLPADFQAALRLLTDSD